MRNKEKQKEAQRRHYQENKEDYRDRLRGRRKERRIWFDTVVMVDRACSTCGENDIAVLDFHHRNPKDKDATISNLLKGLRSKIRILKEIEKCDVLCANCHRKLHRYQCVV